MSPSPIELDDGPQCCDWCGAAFRNFRFASLHEDDCPVRRRAAAAEAKNPHRTGDAASGGGWQDAVSELERSSRRPFVAPASIWGPFR